MQDTNLPKQPEMFRIPPPPFLTRRKTQIIREWAYKTVRWKQLHKISDSACRIMFSSQKNRKLIDVTLSTAYRFYNSRIILRLKNSNVKNYCCKLLTYSIGKYGTHTGTLDICMIIY